MLLEDEEALGRFGDLAEAYARADLSDGVAGGLALGKLTALQKPNGRLRGIVTGSTFRRVVARALAKQFGEALDRATAPYQFALQTRAGTDALAQAIRTATELTQRRSCYP